MFKKKKLLKEIEQLTMDDILFTTGTTIGTINPHELSLVSTCKTLNNETIFKVQMPFVDYPMDKPQIIHTPKQLNVIQVKKEMYDNYKEKNKEYDSIEIEIFYLSAYVNSLLVNDINDYNIKRYLLSVDHPIMAHDTYYNLKWNIAPFMVDTTEFTEADKRALYEDVKRKLYDAFC